MWLRARRDTHTQRRMMSSSTSSTAQQPIMPNSSPHTAKMLSVCRAGRVSLLGEWVRVPLR